MWETHFYMTAGRIIYSWFNNKSFINGPSKLHVGLYWQKTESLSKKQRSNLLSCTCQCLVCNVDF